MKTTLNDIVLDPRFSDLKTVYQRRRNEEDVFVGYCMHFDGRQFQTADLKSLVYAVSAYMFPDVELKEVIF